MYASEKEEYTEKKQGNGGEKGVGERRERRAQISDKKETRLRKSSNVSIKKGPGAGEWHDRARQAKGKDMHPGSKEWDAIGRLKRKT